MLGDGVRYAAAGRCVGDPFYNRSVIHCNTGVQALLWANQGAGVFAGGSQPSLRQSQQCVISPMFLCRVPPGNLKIGHGIKMGQLSAQIATASQKLSCLCQEISKAAAGPAAAGFCYVAGLIETPILIPAQQHCRGHEWVASDPESSLC